MKKIHPLVLICTIVCYSLSGCTGPNKINKWVARHYKEAPRSYQIKNENISVISNLSPIDDNPSYTTQKTKIILPLVFYWEWLTKNTCTINPEFSTTNFANALSSQANESIKQKLASNKLELKIEKMPTTFIIDDRGYMVWIIYALGWDRFKIIPQDKEMVISYRVLTPDKVEIKKGLISIPNTDVGFTLGLYQNLKKKTFQYLNQYDVSITAMSKIFIEKLASEL